MKNKSLKPGLKKQLALTVFQRIRQRAIKEHQLQYLFWESTLRCNLNCVHCGSDCKKESKVKDMPLADFLKVVDEIKPYVNSHKTMIVITGGEPLVRKDLEQCGRQLYQREFPWGIVSNGYLLTQSRLKSLQYAGLRALTISLDGLNQVHDWFRGREGSFDKALNAIKIAAKAEDLAFDVVSCVHQKNIDQLHELKEELINCGVKNWRIFTVFPTGRAKDNPLLQLDNDQFRSVFEFIKQCRSEGKIKASYGCEGYLGSYEAEVRDSFFFCQAGINIASVLADGSISACPSIGKGFAQGNIYTDNFMDVWENRFDVMRNRDWAKTGQCENCKSFGWCQGNGIHLRDDQTGELLMCHYQKLTSP